jgi:hypothetical protein
MVERLNLTVDDGVSQMLTELAEGERKRGQWLTNLVRSMYEQKQQIAVSDFEQVKVGFTGLVATSNALESRVARLERQVATLLADKQ